MRLSIEHVTEYTYDRPIHYAALSLRCQPGNFEGQSVVSWSLTPSEGGQLSEPFTDGYGDRIRTLTALGLRDRLALTLKGVVETSDCAGVLRGWRERAPAGVFLRETPLTEPDDALRQIAEAAAKASDGSALDFAHKLMAEARKAIKYDETATTPRTTAAEALKLGRGVCQDFAHVMISAARAHGLPARYATGYFLNNAHREYEAAHAWAEIRTPEIGWVGFDAANDICPTDAYVRLGSGLDAWDATPIRGAHQGGDGERLSVKVRVAREEGGQTQSQGRA